LSLRRHESLLKIWIETHYAGTIIEALRPELDSLPARRVKASARHTGEGMVLELAARDLVALRAGLNTLLRWVSALERCLRLIEGEGDP